MSDFTLRDSGVRQPYKSGMVRDTQEGKPDYTLIDIPFLTRLAEHLGKGLIKYGRDNWRLANSDEELVRFKSSAMRHLLQWLSGDEVEDHASAVVFNIMAAENVKAKLGKETKDAREFYMVKATRTFDWYQEGEVYAVKPFPLRDGISECWVVEDVTVPYYTGRLIATENARIIS